MSSPKIILSFYIAARARKMNKVWISLDQPWLMTLFIFSFHPLIKLAFFFYFVFGMVGISICDMVVSNPIMRE